MVFTSRFIYALTLRLAHTTLPMSEVTKKSIYMIYHILS